MNDPLYYIVAQMNSGLMGQYHQHVNCWHSQEKQNFKQSYYNVLLIGQDSVRSKFMLRNG